MAKKSKRYRESGFTVWKVRVGERFGSASGLVYLVLSPTAAKAERKACSAAKRRDLMKKPQVESAERLGDLAT